METFNNLFNLEELFLQDNEISVIEENPFKDLKNLKKIWYLRFFAL